MTFFFVFLVLCISFINSIYKEIELKLKNKETDYDLPLYFETTIYVQNGFHLYFLQWR